MPATIDATGRRDVTAELNAFFARVPPATTVSFPTRGRYRVEGIVRITGVRNLTIDGNGASLVATTDGRTATPPGRGFTNHWPRRREHLQVRASTGVIVRGLVVHGANPRAGARPEAYVPNLEGQAGIAVYGSRGVTLEDVTVSDTYGDLVYLAAGTADVQIRRSHLTRSGRQGIAIVGADRVDIADNDIRDVARTVLDLEPPGRSFARGVVLRDNRVGEYRNFLLAATGGGAGVGDVRIVSNDVVGSRGVSVLAGVARAARNGFHVVGNRGSTRARPVIGRALIQLTNLDGVEIRDNRQPVAAPVAVALDRVCNLTMAGNDFSGATREREVVAPCGAPATPRRSPATRRPPTTTTTGSSRAAPATRDSGSGDGATGTIVAVGVALVAGGAIGGAAVWTFTRRRR